MANTKPYPEAAEKILKKLGYEIKGNKFQYTSLNGHMFTYFGDDSFGIRLDKATKKEFEDKFNTSPFIQYNSVMNGYVTVPQNKLDDTKFIEEYIKLSIKYIKTLPKK